MKIKELIKRLKRGEKWKIGKRYQPTPEDIAMLQTMNTGKIKRSQLKYWLTIAFWTAVIWCGFVWIVLTAIDSLPDPLIRK